MSNPYVRICGIGVDVCIIVIDEIDGEIVRMAMAMASKRAAQQQKKEISDVLP